MGDLRQTAVQSAQKYGLDPAVFQRQINQESGFNPHARSGAGARGVAQIMPGTARAWGVNPDDPYAALDAAAKHMAQYVKQYGSYRNALIAYNAGPGAVGSRRLPAETVNYVNTILGGKGGGSGGSAGYGPAVGRSYLPAQNRTDTQQAAIDALLAHAQSPNDSLLKEFVNNLDSGLYTTHVPAVGATYSLPGIGGSSATVSPGQLPKGVAHFDSKPVAAWIAQDLQWARQHGWTGTVSSGVRSDAEQLHIWNSGVRPAAKPRSLGGSGSNHEMTAFPGGAVDVSNAQQLSEILAKKPGGSLLKWAGSKDPVHFSHPHNGSY